MEIFYKKPSKIIPYKNNPRKNEDAIDKVATSISEYGFKQPIVIDEKNIIVVGHTRWKAALKMNLKEVPVLVAKDLTPAQIKAYRIADNKTNEFAEWDFEQLNIELTELDEADVDLEWLEFDEGLFEDEDIDPIESENIDKDIKDIKILNLYAGIGGNRKLWGDLDVTAVEYNEEIAKAYQDFFPNDKVIVDDAHEYLEEHFNEFDFIWASPPCPTHSRIRKNAVGNTKEKMSNGIKPIYPDMQLWQEILFLQGYFEGKWVVENVISWYEPLIEPAERSRHYYWSNFDIPENEVFNIIEGVGQFGSFDSKKHEKKFGYNLDKYNFSSDYPKEKILRNMVHPKTGEYILKCAYKDQFNKLEN